MGYEFFIKVGKDSKPSLEQLAHQLSLNTRYSLERKNESCLSFRWRDKPRQANWPEDFVINDDGEALILTVYSATRLERNAILHDVQSAVEIAGHTVVSVEEI